MKKSQVRDKTLSVKVPEDVAEDIEYVKGKLTEIDPSRKFNINAICVDAVRRAVKKAKKELAAMENKATDAERTGGTAHV